MAISRTLRRVLSYPSLLLHLQALISVQQRWNHTHRAVTGITKVRGKGLTPHFESPSSTSNQKIVDSNDLRIKTGSILPSAYMVLSTLQKNGYVAYLVGGCVRDLILQRAPKDFDIITAASLKQIRKCFRRCRIIGSRFPICQVHILGNIVEVSSFDTAVAHGGGETILLPKLSDNYNDKDLAFWKNCMKRDFTINCLFFNPFKCKIYDYVGALKDLKASMVRTVIPPHLSFKEDCARILRGIRIAARLGLKFSKDTETAIKDFSSSIQTLPKNRLMMEMNFMMAHGAAASSINLLQKFNLLKSLFPAHAVYLTSQSNSASAQKSVMLMKLLKSADNLLRADRPCCCNLWLGLLAFHLALIDNPQDALVIWTFSSVLYYGTWHEAVAFGRGSSNGLNIFIPEILQPSLAKPDDVLFKEISRFLSLVKSAVKVLTDIEVLQQSLAKYSLLIAAQHSMFVPPTTGKKVCRIFDVMNDCKSRQGKKVERHGINYQLLKEGELNETRFVLGKIIMDTMKDKPTSEPAAQGKEIVRTKQVRPQKIIMNTMKGKPISEPAAPGKGIVPPNQIRPREIIMNTMRGKPSSQVDEGCQKRK